MPTRVLTEADELPRHQTISTFDTVANSNPEWNDGYWFCFGDPAGEVNLITGIRLYHNTNVIDAYVIVSTQEGKQYNLRASRRLRPRIDDIAVGPFWQEIIRGLHTIRLGCDENPHQVAFDVLWESTAPPHDEATGVQNYRDGRLVGERSNYVQVGALSGWVEVGGKRWEFTVEDGWAGARDHSWGQGYTGAGEKPNQYAAPVVTDGKTRGGWGGPGMRHWGLIKFPDRSLFYAFMRNSDGTYSESGTGARGSSAIHSVIDHNYGSDIPKWSYTDVEALDHEWVDGQPLLKCGRINLTRPDGSVDRFQVDVVSKPVHMQGGGYWGGWNDQLGRGIYRGEEYVEGEIWDISHPVKIFTADWEEVPPTPAAGAAYWEVYALYTNLDDPNDVGLGILEAAIIGDYEGVKAR